MEGQQRRRTRDALVDAAFAATAAQVAMRAATTSSERPVQATAAVVLLHVVLAVLFLARSPARREGGVRATLAALPSILVGAAVGMLPLHFTSALAWLFFAGALGASFSLMRLGRSFAVLPSVREVEVRGPYRLVRHPAYACELVMFFAVALAMPRPLVGGLLAALATITIAVRILAEERVLNRAADYRGYAQQVRWRLLPGVW